MANTVKQNVVGFEAIRQEQAEKVASKGKALAKAKDDLAEAKALYENGNAKADEAATKASQGALPLYLAQSSGMVTKEEVSSILGEVFGYKAKTNGSGVSKTPDGKGEDIRKRIVRAVDAKMYADGKTDTKPTWAGNATREDILSIMNRIEEGEWSIWHGYNELGNLKGKTEAVDIAFDEKRLTKIVASLLQDGAADKVAKSPALMSVYAALDKAISELGEKVILVQAAEKKAA